MREIFVNSIPKDKDEKKIKKVMEIFGEVDKIDIYPKQVQQFAYVKFKKISEAHKVFYLLKGFRVANKHFQPA